MAVTKIFAPGRKILEVEVDFHTTSTEHSVRVDISYPSGEDRLLLSETHNKPSKITAHATIPAAGVILTVKTSNSATGDNDDKFSRLTSSATIESRDGGHKPGVGWPPGDGLTVKLKMLPLSNGFQKLS